MAEEYEPAQAHGGRFETDEDYEPSNRGGRSQSHSSGGRGSQSTSRSSKMAYDQ